MTSKLLVTAFIQNLSDVYEAEKGYRKTEEIRSVRINDAEIDMRMTALSMPRRLIKILGLEKFRAVRLTILGRECSVDVAELPNDGPVLIGGIVLGILDIVVDPKRPRLIGNPEHGGKFMYDMF